MFEYKNVVIFFFRIVAKTSDEQGNIEVKMEHDASAQSSIQKQKRIKERSTTQVCTSLFILLNILLSIELL